MGRARVEIMRILYKDPIERFEAMFFEELDSWFNSEIACCDECFDDFVRLWPYVSSRSSEFATASTPLFVFYSGSGLSELFTKEEFEKYLITVHCPRCGAPLRYNIWPYEHRFELPKLFESDIVRIIEIGQRTPFMIATDPFARRIRRRICQLNKTALDDGLGSTLFRGRRVVDVTNREDVSSFGPPPRSATSEGRYNHAGRPAYYLASDPPTCYRELGRPDGGVLVAALKQLTSLRTLDLVRLTDMPDDLIAPVIASALLSAPSENIGWDQPQYTFSRYVADCALDAGFDCIRYPSVESASGFNIVMLSHPEEWEKRFKIVSVEKVVSPASALGAEGVEQL